MPDDTGCDHCGSFACFGGACKEPVMWDPSGPDTLSIALSKRPPLPEVTREIQRQTHGIIEKRWEQIETLAAFCVANGLTPSQLCLYETTETNADGNLVYRWWFDKVPHAPCPETQVSKAVGPGASSDRAP